MKNILPNITTTQLSSIIVGFMIFITMIIATPQVQAQFGVPGTGTGTGTGGDDVQDEALPPVECELYPGTHSSQPATDAPNGCNGNNVGWWQSWGFWQTPTYEDLPDSSTQWLWQCYDPHLNETLTCSADKIPEVETDDPDLIQTLSQDSSTFENLPFNYASRFGSLAINTPLNISHDLFLSLGCMVQNYDPINNLGSQAKACLSVSGTGMFSNILVNQPGHIARLFVGGDTTNFSNHFFDIQNTNQNNGSLMVSGLNYPNGDQQSFAPRNLDVQRGVCADNNGMLIACAFPSGDVPVNATCGSAAGTTTPNPPADNLCATGSPSVVTAQTNGTYTWTCTGDNDGTDVSCQSNQESPEPLSCEPPVITMDDLTITNADVSATATEPTGTSTFAIDFDASIYENVNLIVSGPTTLATGTTNTTPVSMGTFGSAPGGWDLSINADCISNGENVTSNMLNVDGVTYTPTPPEICEAPVITLADLTITENPACTPGFGGVAAFSVDFDELVYENVTLTVSGPINQTYGTTNASPISSSYNFGTPPGGWDLSINADCISNGENVTSNVINANGLMCSATTDDLACTDPVWFDGTDFTPPATGNGYGYYTAAKVLVDPNVNLEDACSGYVLSGDSTDGTWYKYECVADGAPNTAGVNFFKYLINDTGTAIFTDSLGVPLNSSENNPAYTTIGTPGNWISGSAPISYSRFVPVANAC